jgi:hypothetical protein
VRTAVRVPVSAEIYDDPKAIYNERTRRAKTVKAVSVERGPIVANARAAAAAKAAFAGCVEALLDNLGDPLLLVLGGHVGVVWITVGPGAEAVEWRYRIVTPDDTLGIAHTGMPTAQDAERRCRLHLAQYATDYSDDDSVLAAWDFLLPEQRHDHLRYAARQRARSAADGVEVADRHQWAGDHQDDYLPALLAAVDARRGAAV